jgi:hypothetical protein
VSALSLLYLPEASHGLCRCRVKLTGLSGLFGSLYCQSRFRSDFGRELQSFLDDVFRHPADETPFLGLLSGETPTAEHVLCRPRPANEPRQPLRPTSAWNDSELNSCATHQLRSTVGKRRKRHGED